MRFLLHLICCLQFVSSFGLMMKPMIFGLMMKRMPRFMVRSRLAIKKRIVCDDQFDVDSENLDFDPKMGDFPCSDGGAVVFQRSHLVKRMVDTFTTRAKNSAEYSNFYFRHSSGTGKTVLLKLFGKELQLRGFVVLKLTAPELKVLENGYFEKLTDKMAQVGKQVAVLVDQVPNNIDSYHWAYLLKKAPSNLLVIGTGNYFTIDFPPFQNTYPSTNNPAIGPLTEEDMPEVLDYFVPPNQDDSQRDLKTKALRELLIATGGQAYPFVILAKHLLEPERAEHLSDVSAYLTSKAFYHSEDYALVTKRCFGDVFCGVELLSHFLMEQRHKDEEMKYIMKYGLWIGTNFVSPILVQEIFRQLLGYYSSDEFKVDLSAKTSPVVQQIIVAGLANMTPVDLDESNYSTLANNERGLAFVWATRVGLALKNQLWLAPEVVPEGSEGQTGTKPTTDFVVSELNLGLHVAKDRTDEAMLDKISKIGKGGVHSRRDSYLLHFVSGGTVKDAVRYVHGLPIEVQNRVYTFVKNSNTLMCGTKVVQKKVARKLLPPRPLRWVL